MCGILGLIRSNQQPCAEGLRGGLDRLRHRGPDGVGTEDDGIAAFGHRRLAILDLSSAAAQPMRDASGRYLLTYNGEVYNFHDIRRRLEGLGHRFRTTSDTEVVLEAYARWGTHAFARFDGMFALALWDSKDRRLVLARDRFGEKPLYYALLEHGVAFASELSAILAAGWVARKPPSVVAWADYLALGYIPGPESAHPDVRKVDPATFMTFEWGKPPTSTRYWDYAAAFRSKHRGSERDMVAGLEDALKSAVSSRLVSDVPVGAFLSGGLDSSTIVALMRPSVANELHTFSVSFDRADYDEAPDALRVARRYRTTHHEHRIDAAEGLAIAEDAAGVFDEPFSDTSLLPMVAVAREASKYVKVALSGDGADELLAGYTTYRADVAMQWLARAPAPLRRAASIGIRRFISEETTGKTTWRFKVRQFAHGLPLLPQAAHATWRKIHAEDEIVGILGKERAQILREHPPSRLFDRHYQEVEDLPLLDQHLYVDAKTWLVDDILVKVDRSAMASSLESRAPFLARGFAEFAAGMPPHLKLGPRRGKIALREIARPLLPPQTMRKAKAGFGAPLNAWFGWTDDNEYRRFNRVVRDWWTRRNAASLTDATPA